MTQDLDEISYWLEQIAQPDVWRDYLIPILGILATMFLGLAAVLTARASNRIAGQNTELALRAERRRYGDAVIAYYESRHPDVRSGKNHNMPHWTETPLAIATELGEPNAAQLMSWVTATIDHATSTGPEEDRAINAAHIKAIVPVVVAKWVSHPTMFNEPAFKLWHERNAAARPSREES
ncbi:hypothetical protein [Microbacterium sp. NPDC089696]|uniref:hypothetical protein n=1 Tax=Microbacterium sp. NPDC089696 TaxID=3364199 RepID=UPI003803CFF7